eukprot:3736185-Rhodomonas_salina.1
MAFNSELPCSGLRACDAMRCMPAHAAETTLEETRCCVVLLFMFDPSLQKVRAHLCNVCCNQARPSTIASNLLAPLPSTSKPLSASRLLLLSPSPTAALERTARLSSCKPCGERTSWPLKSNRY